MADNNTPPIIKKIKKGHGHGHHGGAWKVAYADFVTAMMAFFLLLWLLSATTEEQKIGIASYFNPTAVSDSATSGAGAILGGQSIMAPGSLQSPTAPVTAVPDIEIVPPGAEEQDPDQPLGFDRQAEIEKAIEEAEEKEFAAVEEAIEKAIEEEPELALLKDSLVVERTPEGLRIQIVDQEKVSMFPLGSSDMYDYTKQLIGKVSQVITKMDNKITISGHTDATPYSPSAKYTNWELSTDRANSSRRALVESGFPEQRIAWVLGKADKQHLFPDDPQSPRNRRISIVLLKDSVYQKMMQGQKSQEAK